MSEDPASVVDRPAFKGIDSTDWESSTLTEVGPGESIAFIVLEAMEKKVTESLKGEKANIPIVENPLPTSNVELIDTRMRPLLPLAQPSHKPVRKKSLLPLRKMWEMEAEKNDAQIGDNEAYGMDVDLHTEREST